MALFFMPFVARKHGRYSGACYIPGRFFKALQKIEIIHGVPILAIDWPSDSFFELITDSSENKAIGELMDDLIFHRFEYSKCEKIKSVQSLMLQRLKSCNKFTLQTPKSVKIKNTRDYVKELKKRFPDYNIQPTMLSISLSLVYE